ncbi:MAG TPA: DUF2809 domain-containing protein [Candidatus Marinimicrobia bacterium]|nr:DUF2809 domain-containing protein [Candidatus Neomarinimicrobiota bacterium]HRS52071.1 DUF2809 domain-containing protein [Candidatus Neomarinimicrobiota bacterium]HRU93067.1 DUF2809 domain-containing protein [Candidatus Neomarinimicrobiota bacterium]
MTLRQLFKRADTFKILIILIIVPIGFYTKFYSGPLQKWVSYSLGDFLYEIFWCLLISLFFPRLQYFRVAIIVFSATGIIEFLQLWHLPILEKIRETFLGRTLIGNYFIWSDFIYYAIGCLAGYFILKVIDRVKTAK